MTNYIDIERFFQERNEWSEAVHYIGYIGEICVTHIKSKGFLKIILDADARPQSKKSLQEQLGTGHRQFGISLYLDKKRNLSQHISKDT